MTCPLDIIITTFNRPHKLLRAAESCAPYCDRLIVIDDGSDQWLPTTLPAKAEVIGMPEHTGRLGPLRDRAIAATRRIGGAPFVTWVDDDDYLLPVGMEVLLWRLSNFPNIEALATGYKMLFADDRLVLGPTSDIANVSPGCMRHLTVVSKEAYFRIGGHPDLPFAVLPAMSYRVWRNLHVELSAVPAYVIDQTGTDRLSMRNPELYNKLFNQYVCGDF